MNYVVVMLIALWLAMNGGLLVFLAVHNMLENRAQR